MTSNITEGISATGLTLKTYNDILEELKSEFNSIYAQDGEVINFDSDTQDGQILNIFAQAGSDMRELVREVFNSFNPDNCNGAVADQRFALNYITRKSGTFTIQNIDVTVNDTITLQGLDGNYNNPEATSYTVSDASGQLWFLIDTTTLTPGTSSLPFRSQNYGLYMPALNTITIQTTIIPGVVSVTNSVAPTTLGENQETDSEFKIRRERSTQIKGQNNLDALQGAILDLEGVTDVFIHNNATNSTDDTGTASNHVWIIVEGGANNEIGALIYQYSCGKPTRGNVTVDMQSISGEVFPTSFDRATPIPLYIKFDYLTASSAGTTFLDALADYIAQNLTYKLNQTAESSEIYTIINNGIAYNGGSGFPMNVKVSIDDENWYNYIESSSLQNKFVVDATRIEINNVIGST